MREHVKSDPGAEASTLIGRMTVVEERKKDGQEEKEGLGSTAPSMLSRLDQNGKHVPLDTTLTMATGDSGKGATSVPPMTPASNASLPPLLVSPSWSTLQGPSPSSAGHVSSAGRVSSAPTPPVPIFPLSPTSTQPLAPSPSPLGASPAPLLPTPTASANLATSLDAPVPFPGFSPGPSPAAPPAEALGASGVPHTLFFSVRSPPGQAPPKGVATLGMPAAGGTMPEAETGAGAGTGTGPDARTQLAPSAPQVLGPEAGAATAQVADRESQMQALEGRFMLMNEVIGEGKFGTVTPAVDRATGEVLACKRVGKRAMVRAGAEELLEREVAAMVTLQRAGGHRNIVQLRAKFEDEDSVCLLMDLCEEGELYDELVRRGVGSKAPFTSTEAGRAFFQIVSGVAFCHANGVVHRDLKPENILLTRSKPNASPFPALPCSPFPNKGPAGAQSAPASPFSRALAAFAGVVPASPGAPSPARALPFTSPMAARHLAPIPMPASASSRLEHAHPASPPAATAPAHSPDPCPSPLAAADASMSIPSSPDADMPPAKEDSIAGESGNRGPGLPATASPPPASREGPRSPAAVNMPVPVPVPATAKSARGSPGSTGARGALSPGGRGARASPGSKVGPGRSLCAQNDGFRAPAPVFGRRARRAPASVPAKLCPIYEGGEEEGEGEGGAEELLRRQAGRAGTWASNPWGRLGQRSSTAVKRDREGHADAGRSPGSDPAGAEGAGSGGGGALSEGGQDGGAGRSVRRCLRMNGAPGSAPRPTRGSSSPRGLSSASLAPKGRHSPGAASAAARGGHTGDAKEGKGARGLSNEGLTHSGTPPEGLRPEAGPRQVKRCLLPSPGSDGAEGAQGVETRGKRRLLQKASPEKDAEAGRKHGPRQGQGKEPAPGGAAPGPHATSTGVKDVNMDGAPAVHQANEGAETASHVPAAAGTQRGDSQQHQKEQREHPHPQPMQVGGPRGEHILKIADFGLAVVLEPQETAKGVAGSPMYMAPEACAGSYDAKADVWSLGVILYILLCGSHPFPDMARAERERKARRLQHQKQQQGAGEGGSAVGEGARGGDGEGGKERELRRGIEALKLDENGYPVLSWPRRDGYGVPGALPGEGGPWGAEGAARDPIPEAAKGLVRSLLHSNPARRPTARKILTHPWLLQCVYGGSVVRRKGLSPLAQKSPVKGALPKPVPAKTALTPLRAPPNGSAGAGVGASPTPWSPAGPSAAAGAAAVTPVRQSSSTGRELFPPPSPWSPAALGLGGSRHGHTPGRVPGSPAAGARHGEGGSLSGAPRAPLAQPGPARSGTHPHRSQVVLIPISPYPPSPLSKPPHKSTPRPVMGGTVAGVGVGSAPASASKPPQSPLRPSSSQAAAAGTGVSSPWKPVSRGALGPSRMRHQGDNL